MNQNKEACYTISAYSNKYAIIRKHWNGDGREKHKTAPSTDIMSEHD